jgi:heme/copper-type cytochrome/quinol oxidase subunit 2
MLGWWLPENVSTYGDSVFHLMYWTSGVGLLVAQALLSRWRDTDAPSHPMLEVVWAVVPTLILVWLGLLSHRSLNGCSEGRPQIALEQAQNAAPWHPVTSHTGDGEARGGAQ